MRRLFATLVALSLLMSMFTGVFASVPEARAAGPAAVNLGTAGNFVVLAKTGISTTGTTHVTGDIGVSPAAANAITGFALVAPPTTFTTSALVTGKVYAADYDSPTPTYMTTAVSDMEAAYIDAAGRTAGVGPFLNVGGGTVAGQTLAPGVYTWGSNVTITTDLTLSGGANGVWIFQIAGTLDIATGKNIILAGGALAKNIFWQVAGAVTLFPTSHFEGNILAKTNIAMQTGATLNGRLLAQTAVTLDANTISAPTPGNKQQPRGKQQVRGKVTFVTATVLHVDGFASDIVLNADTKVEQVGTGSTNIAAIKVGQTVQVHVVLSGTTYTAQQVHIQDKYVKAAKGKGKH